MTGIAWGDLKNSAIKGAEKYRMKNTKMPRIQ